MKLALFDLDNTLLAGDSDFEWAQFLIGKGVLDREVHEATNLEFYEQYKAGTLDIHAFLDFQLAPLARHPRAELDAWHREFLATRIRPLISPAARALVRHATEAGDLLAIVTATNSFVTGPIAREFGIPHLIATIPAQENGASPASRAAPPRSATARSSASTPGSNRSASGWAASNRAGSTATRTTTCRCWSRSRTRSRSMPMPR
jgi:phosphoserine phosphatase